MRNSNFIFFISVAVLLIVPIGLLPAPAHAVAPTNGLIGYWNFDEGSGTIAEDSSGNGNTGTLVNGSTWTTGKVGSGAVSFDGVNDEVTMPHNSSLIPS